MEKRTLIALGLILLILYLSNKFIYAPPPREVPPETPPLAQETAEVEEESLTPVPEEDTPAITQGDVRVESPETTVVETGKYRLLFSSQGGALVGATLKGYEYLPDGSPVKLIHERQSRFLSMALSMRKDTLDLREATFAADTKELVLSETDSSGSVAFTAVVGDRDTVRTTYSFTNGSYLIRADVELPAPTRAGDAWRIHQMLGPAFNPTEKDSMKDDFPNVGAAYLEGGKVGEKKMNDFEAGESGYVVGPLPWVSMKNKYFMVGLISRAVPYDGVVVRGDKKLRTFEMVPVIALAPGENRASYDIYVGPQDYRTLKAVGLGLEKMVEYGWWIIRPFTRFILVIMLWMHKFITNYGFVIIVFSAFTKIIFYPLTKKSLQATKDMQKLQPLMKELREKYKSDPRKMQEETMRLYREHKVNPLGGCLPLLIQMPVLWALFYVFQRTIEFRGAEFALWIRDLSAPDSPPVLPIIMGASMYWQQKMTPTTDPRMAPMQYIMPVVLTILFITFPAGLVLYWTVNNLMSILQQYYMKKGDEKVTRGGATKGNRKGNESGERH
jgi:YidC/Oxa1 family membrane protein insertase